MAEKISWCGTLVSVQPRIRLIRSFDQRSHAYLGYLLRVDGVIDDEARQFTVGVGKVLILNSNVNYHRQRRWLEVSWP